MSWNTRDLLRECLDAALGACRALNHPAEVIVVDNASADSSADMVRHEFPDVRLIGNTSNRGFAAAANQGLRESRGRYLLLLNPDTKVDRNSLSALAAFLDENPGAGVAGPRIVGRDGADCVSCFPLPTLATELWRLLHLDRFHELSVYPPDMWRSGRPQKVDTVQGACMLIRREALDDAGFLDERFFIYTEEVDLCRRMRDLDWEIWWVPGAVITHYGGESTRQARARMFLELYRSKVQYFRKYMGFRGAMAYKAVLLAAILPRVLLPFLLIAIVPSKKEQLRPILRDYSTLLYRLPAL